MKIQFYIRIEGEESVLRALHQDLAKVWDGAVIERKGGGRPLVDSRPQYWASARIDSTLENLSADLSAFLKQAVGIPRIGAGLGVTVVVVATCYENAEQPGVYLDAELIGLIAGMGASFDYDIVPHIR